MLSRVFFTLATLLFLDSTVRSQTLAANCAPGSAQVRCLLRDAGVKWPALAVQPPATAGPFQRQIETRLFSGANAVVEKIDVPDGFQLIIESVSVSSSVPRDQMPRVSISTTVRGSPGTYFVPVTRQDAAAGIDFLVGTQPLHVYADPPSALVLVSRRQNDGDAEFNISISGTLVALPPAP